MSDVTGLYVNAKHASCHDITCELIPDSPFYFHHSEGRAWEQGYPLPSLYNVQLSKVHFVCTALSNSLLPQSHKDTILEQKLRADTGLLQANPELVVSLNCILNIFPPLAPIQVQNPQQRQAHTAGQAHDIDD